VHLRQHRFVRWRFGRASAVAQDGRLGSSGLTNVCFPPIPAIRGLTAVGALRPFNALSQGMGSRFIDRIPLKEFGLVHHHMRADALYAGFRAGQVLGDPCPVGHVGHHDLQ